MKNVFAYAKDDNIEKLMKMHPISDAGARKALINYMVSKHYNEVYKSLYNYVSDKKLTEDILQEAFLQTSRRFNQIRSLSSFVPYSVRAAKNIAKKVIPYEKMIRMRSISIYKDDGCFDETLCVDLNASRYSNDPCRIAEYRELKACVEDFLKRLSSLEREIIVSRAIHNEPYKSMERRLGINPSTIRSKCHRIRKGLAAYLKEHYY